MLEDNLKENDFIASVTQWRGAIIYDYANTEFLLAKLIMHCSNLTHYSEFMPLSFPYPMPKRLKLLRKIASKSNGPLALISMELLLILDEFEKYAPLRHTMAHSAMTFQYRADNPTQSTVTFQRYEFLDGGELTLRREVFTWHSLSHVQADTASFGLKSVKILTDVFIPAK